MYNIDNKDKEKFQIGLGCLNQKPSNWQNGLWLFFSLLSLYRVEFG